MKWKLFQLKQTICQKIRVKNERGKAGTERNVLKMTSDTKQSIHKAWEVSLTSQSGEKKSTRKDLKEMSTLFLYVDLTKD